MTDSRPDTDPSVPKPRGLWSLMGVVSERPQPEATAENTDATPQISDEGGEASPTTDSNGEPSNSPVGAPRQRGLWGVMQAATSDLQVSKAHDIPQPGAEDGQAEDLLAGSESQPFANPWKQGAQSLFALMQRGAKSPDTPGDYDLDRTLPYEYSRVPPNEQGNASVPSSTFEPDAKVFDHPSDELAGSAQDEFTTEEIDDLLEELQSGEPLKIDEENLNSTNRSARRRFAEELPPVSDGIDDEEFETEPLELPAPSVHRPRTAIDLSELEPVRFRKAESDATRQSWMALAFGIASSAVSPLAMAPQIWAGFPATILGFSAIIAAYLAFSGAARRQISAVVRASALAGMLFGAIGIFLGPLLFTSLGRDLRDSNGRLATSRHLAQISGGLDRHYGDHGEYPVGGAFKRNEAGIVKGQHGWMTILLPFIGESELYHRIDLTRPFDDAINRVAMGQDVIPYFASSGDRSKIGQGFAAAHFAGLGGEIDEDGKLAHIGIFERDSPVKRDEISDGLSQTLIIGELGSAYPPWGDPENWRMIGRGLNKDPNGFGSANALGATFLFADGVVKHFGNKTDPKLLQSLSTRDGAE